MTVNDLLQLQTFRGNANIIIRGTTEKNKYVDLWKGKMDDIKFPLVPYAKYEIAHTFISADESNVVLILDSSLNFAEINPDTVGMTAYIGNQVITEDDKEVIHFHDSVMKCSAILVDWAKLNKLNDTSTEFFKYLGNYMDDNSTTTYALFGDFPKRYCVKL